MILTKEEILLSCKLVNKSRPGTLAGEWLRIYKNKTNGSYYEDSYSWAQEDLTLGHKEIFYFCDGSVLIENGHWSAGFKDFNDGKGENFWVNKNLPTNCDAYKSWKSGYDYAKLIKKKNI